MRNRMHSSRSRDGFTLIELMIVVALLGIIGAMLTTILVRQQRFHRAVTNLTDTRARMRDISTIMPTDLRSVSTAGGDLLAISDTSMQFRAFIGASVMCRFASAQVIELPPKVLSSGSVLSAWINPPAPNDIVYVYDEGTQGGNVDDTWQPFTITDTTSATDGSWCPPSTNPAYTTAADNGARRYRLTLSAAPNPFQVETGAPLRFAREVRYSIYQATDNQWYVGFQRCTPNVTYGQPGTCAAREVLAGPVMAGTADTLTSGLYFVYRNKAGARLTALASTDTIASVGIGIRTASESLLRATTKTGGSMVTGDSLRFTIGFRNRI
ncbi:MAG TPA: prepilin-type N-terminal cleavage/methylation domain-containing protein [Gemmatimonadaceae bacterium]|nr:prepilin-type N-terminal cleavage/methylation domain-containing protein [Gemmatimonadaceae bacterium]